MATTSDRLASGGGYAGKSDYARQSVVVPAPDELPKNDNVATTDTSGNFFERFTALH